VLTPFSNIGQGKYYIEHQKNIKNNNQNIKKLSMGLKYITGKSIA
jgi:hypothetical protein